jgi:hypothetical protein
MGTPNGSTDNVLAILARALYGSDEEISKLGRKEALELSGRDQKWFSENKKKLENRLKERLITLRLETIRSERKKTLVQAIPVTQRQKSLIKEELKAIWEKMKNNGAPALALGRNFDVDTLSEEEAATMLGDIEFLTKGNE